MKKRALSIILAMILLIGILPIQANAGQLDNGLEYEVYKDHVEITDYSGSATEVVIPAEIEGLPVTSIGNYAFSDCSSLTDIVIPERVTSIGDHAFRGCSSLIRISVDEKNPNYSSDDRGVLFDKTKTRLIRAPGAITDTYTIPDSVTSIGSSAFYNCSRLTGIVIPDSVTSIGYFAFGNCYFLLEIVIPDSVTSIDDYAFWYCPNLTSIVISEGVTSIGDYAFNGCSSLTSIELPKGVTSIGDYAFEGCSSLTDIVIPDSVTSIGSSAFRGCSSLIRFSVDEKNPNYSSDDRGVLFDKTKTFLICAPGAITDTYTIPDSVTSIDDYAFWCCSSLTDIVIPDSVTHIGDRAFSSCTSLTSIELPKGITSIGDYAFYYCTSLTDIVIPEGVTSIGLGAFYNCSSLTSIVIPHSVVAIYEGAFENCSSLTDIRFKGDAPEMYEIFYNTTATAYYPAGNPTWTKGVMRFCGGNITWVPYNPNIPFSDVPVGSWYEEPVLWAIENGITAGTSANSFSPEDQCLRSHVVSFLWRAAGYPEPTLTENPFDDVNQGDFFYKPALWAVENGITSGLSANRFGSYDVCSRAQVVAFLWRAAGCPEPTSTINPFTDVKPGDYFYKSVLWAVENGITSGISATLFAPDDACNRAQVVTFLYRVYN